MQETEVSLQLMQLRAQRYAIAIAYNINFEHEFRI